MARGLRLAANEYDSVRRTREGYADIRPRAIPERDILSAVMQVLGIHPKVAWARRRNVGAAKLGGHYVRFGKKGEADITGQMKDGRRLEVEVKREGENPEPEQVEFMAMVARYNGVVILARGVQDVLRALA